MRRRKFFIVSLFLFINFLVFGKFFGTAGDIDNKENGISMMSYNVRGLNIYEQLPIADLDSIVYQFVTQKSPDIFCVQEADYKMKRSGPLDEIYPYKYVDFVYGRKQNRVINAIYSKLPILKVRVVNFEGSNNAAIYSDILVDKDTIRIYNIHLQSFRVSPNVTHLQEENSGILFNRITKAIHLQERQAELILNDIKNCPYPVIVSGDFNATQFTKVYKAFREKDFQDSFLEAGSGLGRTLKFLGFPVRIDYILADTNFEFMSHSNFDVELSDHYPIMATFALKPNE